MLSGNNGLIERAGDAKDNTIVGQEKEQVELAYVSAAVNNLGENVTAQNLKNELDNIVGKNKTTVRGSGTLKVKFEDTQNEYTISKNGKVKKYEVPELTDIYVALCRDKDETDDENENGNILVFSNNEEDISKSYTIIEEYGNIKGNTYGYDKEKDTTVNTPWWNINYPIEVNNIYSVSFINEIVPESTAEWFYCLFYLKQFINIENLNTSRVTDMHEMFRYCKALKNLDLSSFDTSNVTNMSQMFSNCQNNLEKLDLSSFDTSKVTDMSYMFLECDALTDLNISSFDTSNVTNMNSMFCGGFKTLDLSNFDTTNVTDMGYMFGWCYYLTTIYVSDKFVTSNVTSGDEMFLWCESLVGGNGTAYDLEHRNFDYAHIDEGTANPGYFTSK